MGAFLRTSQMEVAVLISKTIHYTMPNVCPTKELVKLIASTYKLRFVNQLAYMQKSTFMLWKICLRLIEILRYAPRTYTSFFFFKATFSVKRRFFRRG